MNQSTHAWIAIRAIGLLENEGEIKNLVNIIKPFSDKAAIGAWIPDKRDAKLGVLGLKIMCSRLALSRGDS